MQCAKAVSDLSQGYEEALSSMTDTQREQLDAYISACEAMDDSLLHLAYQLGRTHVKIVVVPPSDREA